MSGKAARRAYVYMGLTSRVRQVKPLQSSWLRSQPGKV